MMMPVECHTLDTEDATLQLKLFGAGSPLLMLHGGPGVGDYLADSVLVECLSAFHTVCTYDQRGCRDSVSDGPFTLQGNVDDIEAVRAFLGAVPLTLVGHSWGAFLALYYAALHPQAVCRLVQLSPVPPSAGWEKERERRLDANLTAEQRAELKRIDSEIAAMREPAQREELYRRRFNVALPAYLAAAHHDKAPRIEWYSRKINTETMADLQRAYRMPDWQLGLRAFRAPMLVVHGVEDSIPISAVRKIEKLIHQARVVGLENCGHFPWLERPEALRNVLVPFLAP